MNALYRTPRTYFDNNCTEYNTYPIGRKLLDIGYAIWHGHDIMEDIRYILENYPYVSEDNIRFAVYAMLAELNHCQALNYRMSRHASSLEADVKTLVVDLMKAYRLPAGNNGPAYIADDPSRIYFHELRSMNGWTEALKENRQPYQMFSDGDWIMFPGDGEIIRQFNLNNITEGKGYLSYVYPEPWYGCPTSAKIIVLGSEARYDDHISRAQNIILSKLPRYAEVIQLQVDSWLRLEGGEFSPSGYIGSPEDGIKTRDIYNSPTYHFWLNNIFEFVDFMDLSRQKVFDNIAVINANPYTAHNVAPLEPGLLPSHYFLRQVVRYIVNNSPDVLFILPARRLHSVWKEILGDVFDDIVARNRIISTGMDKGSISLIGNLNMDRINQFHELLRDK